MDNTINNVVNASIKFKLYVQNNQYPFLDKIKNNDCILNWIIRNSVDDIKDYTFEKYKKYNHNNKNNIDNIETDDIVNVNDNIPFINIINSDDEDNNDDTIYDNVTKIDKF